MRERVAHAAAKLCEVKISPLKDGGQRCVGKNSLAEAVKGIGSRSGKPIRGAVVWQNCLQRDGCRLPVPAIVEETADGQAWSVFEASDVPAAIHKLVGARDAPAYFLDCDFMAQLKALLAKCGIPDTTASIDAVLGTMNATQAERQRQLQAFGVPELCGDGSGGAASFTPRLCDYNGETLISAIDELDWLGLDGRHAWHNWVKKELQDLACSSTKSQKGRGWGEGMMIKFPSPPPPHSPPQRLEPTSNS